MVTLKNNKDLKLTIQALQLKRLEKEQSNSKALRRKEIIYITAEKAKQRILKNREYINETTVSSLKISTIWQTFSQMN